MSTSDQFFQAPIETVDKELLVYPALIEFSTEDVLVEYRLSTCPDKCAERGAGSSRPRNQDLTIIDLMLRIESAVVVVKGLALVIQIPDSDDWQSNVRPVGGLERTPIHEAADVANRNL